MCKANHPSDFQLESMQKWCQRESSAGLDPGEEVPGLFSGPPGHSTEYQVTPGLKMQLWLPYPRPEAPRHLPELP